MFANYQHTTLTDQYIGNDLGCLGLKHLHYTVYYNLTTLQHRPMQEA